MVSCSVTFQVAASADEHVGVDSQTRARCSCRGRVVSVLEGGYGRHIHKHKPKPKASPSKRKHVPKPVLDPQKNSLDQDSGGPCKRPRSAPSVLLASDQEKDRRSHHVRFVVRGVRGRRLPFTPSPKKDRKPLWDDADSAEPIGGERGPSSQQSSAVKVDSAPPIELSLAKANDTRDDTPHLTDGRETPATDCMSLDRSYLANCCLAHVLTLIGQNI